MKENANGQGKWAPEMKRICEVSHHDLATELHRLPWVQEDDTGGFPYIHEHNWPAGIPVEPLFEVVAKHYPDRRRGFSVFGMLVPGQCHTWHMDKEGGKCDIRVHIPIVSNPGCLFIEGNEAFVMTPGWAWEINPLLPHCTGNGGDTNRVHLLFNMVRP